MALFSWKLSFCVLVAQLCHQLENPPTQVSRKASTPPTGESAGGKGGKGTSKPSQSSPSPTRQRMHGGFEEYGMLDGEDVLVGYSLPDEEIPPFSWQDYEHGAPQYQSESYGSSAHGGGYYPGGGGKPYGGYEGYAKPPPFSGGYSPTIQPTPTGGSGTQHGTGEFLGGEGGHGKPEECLLSFPEVPSKACITRGDITKSFQKAVLFLDEDFKSRPLKDPPDVESVSRLAAVLLKTTELLKEQFQLTAEHLALKLPMLDLANTPVQKLCPSIFWKLTCNEDAPQDIDGICNNVEHLIFGAAMAQYRRLLPAAYDDDLQSPRQRGLPMERVVSNRVHGSTADYAAAALSKVFAYWGHLLYLETTFAAIDLDYARWGVGKCCGDHAAGERPPQHCMRVQVLFNDSFYSPYGVTCFDNFRINPGLRESCRLGQRNGFNLVTSTIDGSSIYGVDPDLLRTLRENQGGRMLLDTESLPPLKKDGPDSFCLRMKKEVFCFQTGDVRANMNIGIAQMVILMLSEHNRVAEELERVNPEWDDETLFQTARRIVAAEMQVVTYNEFLPALLGVDFMDFYNLVLDKNYKYDFKVDPTSSIEFAAAAFRFGHSVVPPMLDRVDKERIPIAAHRLGSTFLMPFFLQSPEAFEEFLRGLYTTASSEFDELVTLELRNHLFENPKQEFGLDLVSIDIQRGRDVGLPGYMHYRRLFRLAHSNDWKELSKMAVFTNATLKILRLLYSQPDDIDLYTGGLAEIKVPSAVLGPTFGHIVAEQFSSLKAGDRFWYQNTQHQSAFTPQQIQELNKARMARLLCDNSELEAEVYTWPMYLSDQERNPVIPCDSDDIPEMDFSAWDTTAPRPSPGETTTEGPDGPAPPLMEEATKATPNTQATPDTAEGGIDETSGSPRVGPVRS